MAEGSAQALFDQLMAAGALPEPWHAAYWRTPRHVFIPDTIWVDADHNSFWPLRRPDDPGRWKALAYADDFVATQVDDGQVTPGQPGRQITSSASQPSIVFSMLDHLLIEDGVRVLEVGTGTGYNAGLLAARLGDEQVVTVEVDPAVCAAATGALAGAELYPQVVCGDGAQGFTGGAPYDRIVSTVSVRDVPAAWIEQTRPGGIILTPHRASTYYGDLLLRLVVGRQGTAVGRWVEPGLAFMSLRDQRGPAWSLEDDVPDPFAAETVSAAERDPAEFARDGDAAVAIGLHVPNCHHLTVEDDGSPYAGAFWLLDPASTSWAAAGTDGQVRQAGPRQLWDEVGAALDWWEQHLRPSYDRYGVTVDSTGQSVWLDDPDNTIGAPAPESAQRSPAWQTRPAHSFR